MRRKTRSKLHRNNQSYLKACKMQYYFFLDTHHQPTGLTWFHVLGEWHLHQHWLKKSLKHYTSMEIIQFKTALSMSHFKFWQKVEKYCYYKPSELNQAQSASWFTNLAIGSFKPARKTSWPAWKFIKTFWYQFKYMLNNNMTIGCQRQLFVF